MKIRKEELKKPEEPSAAGRMMGNATNAYRTLDQFFEVRDGDSLAVIVGKITARLFLIFIMILLSPFLMIGLAIAFAAVF